MDFEWMLHPVCLCSFGSFFFSSYSTFFLMKIEICRRQARDEVLRAYPNNVWLAESTRLPYIEGHRAKREIANTDSTLYDAFDICYDYDIYGAWRAVVADAIPVKSYLEMVRLQTTIYPENFIKLRFVENHDQQRVAYIFRNNRLKSLAWTGK